MYFLKKGKPFMKKLLLLLLLPAGSLAMERPQAPIKLVPKTLPMSSSSQEKALKIINEINEKNPEVFKNTSSELQKRVVHFLEKNPGSAIFQLGTYAPIPQALLWPTLNRLFKVDFLNQAKEDTGNPGKYIGYGYFILDMGELNKTRNIRETNIKAYKELIDFSYPVERTRPFLDRLVGQYKIHLMPVQSFNVGTNIIYTLLDAIEKDPALRSQILAFKVSVTEPFRTQSGQLLPFVVIYPRDGKDSAQGVLNKLYSLFKKHPEFKGSGERPRYNAKVNDLIWVAQGDADYKTDEYAGYYEPSRIYYRPDITGRIENYHLKHPETGIEIVN